jgi:hypothetical protein
MLWKKNMKYIVWEKWRDPFLGYDENEIDLDSEVNNFFDEDEEDTDHKTQTNPIKEHGKQIRVIATPMGLIPYNEYTASSKIFNFWIGHTNFNLSKKIVNLIEKTDGVETLDIFTRYRFRIGIGKVFEDREVMKNIENNIKEHEQE